MDGSHSPSIPDAYRRDRDPRRLVDAARVVGQHEQLFQYSLFSSFIFHAITGLALFTLRRKQPDLPRPYRVFGYPWVPALFLVVMTGLVLNTLQERPIQSLLGVGMVALGVPIFRWRRSA